MLTLLEKPYADLKKATPGVPAPRLVKLAPFRLRSPGRSFPKVTPSTEKRNCPPVPLGLRPRGSFKILGVLRLVIARDKWWNELKSSRLDAQRENQMGRREFLSNSNGE
jgi:hypothetical protein